MEKESILDKSQYGFRSKHSCGQAIIELTGKILQAKEQNLESTALFLDLSKAFNTLDHKVLLSKLDCYGICGICNDWFRSYLTGTNLTAKVQTSENMITRSENFSISYGTAQGSCLGLFLFFLFTNDIHLLPTFSSIFLFVDDTTLLNSAGDIHFLKYSFEHDMSILMDWYKANKLSLNMNKTVLLKFWPGEQSSSARVGGTLIENTPSTRFLGVTIDDDLTWKEHVNKLYYKISTKK